MADENTVDINIRSDPTGVEQGSKRSKVAIGGVSKEAKELDASFRRLKTAIDPTFAATEKYNRTLEENKRLLDAGRIGQEEYAAGARAAKQALDQQVASITRNSAAGKAAAAEAKRLKQEEVTATRAKAQAEQIAAREAAAARIIEAKRAAAAVEAAQKKEQAAIALSARIARQSAQAAQRAVASISNPSNSRARAGSIETSRSIKQLENDARRATAAAANAAQRAIDAAARAAEAGSARTARAAENAANRAKQAAENAANRSILLARTKASEEGRAAKESAAAAVAASKEKARAEQVAKEQSRLAAEETRRLAQAERQQANAVNQLRASIDPAFAAQARYNEVMQQATSLLLQNKLQTGEWTKIQKQAKAQQDVNIRNMGRMNTTMVQLGFQAQDVTASLASGINPLVILAQQGGQTAFALSGLGGTIGKVAAFMAGPFGAAIIGVTLLLGLLLDKTKDTDKATKKAKDQTLDLAKAEDVRKASLKKLTEALREYNKEQKEANVNNAEAIRLQGIQTASNLANAKSREAAAIKKVADAQAALNQHTRFGEPLAGDQQATLTYYGELTRLQGKLTAAKKEQKAAQEAVALAEDNAAQHRVEIIQRQAEAATDSSARITQAYEEEEAAALRRFEASSKTRQDEIRLEQDLVRAIRRRKAAENAQSSNSSSSSNARTGDPVGDINNAAAIAKARGFRVGRIGRNGVSKGAGHQQGRAVDINAVAGIDADVPEAKARLDKLATDYQKMGFTVLWNGKRYDGRNNRITFIKAGKHQHRDHLHVEAPPNGARVKASANATAKAADDKLKAAEEFRKAMEDLLKERLEDQLSALDFEQELAQNDIAEQIKIQDKKIALLTDFYGKESRETIRAQRDKIKLERQHQKELAAQAQEGIEQRTRLAEIEANSRADKSSVSLGTEEDNVSFNAANRFITPEQELAQKAQILEKQFALQAAHEERMFQLRVKSIRDQLALEHLPVETRARLNSDLELLEAEHLAQRQLGQADYAREVNRLQNESAQLVIDKWSDVSSSLVQSLSSAFQGMWNRTQSWRDLMVGIADQIVFKFFDMGLKMLEDWALRQLGLTAVTTTGETARTATQAAAEASRTGIVLTNEGIQTGAKVAGAATETGVIAATTGAKLASEGIKTAAAVTGAGASTAATAAAGTAEIGTSAAAAAAGAYKSTVVIPFIGPVAAPAAAALALAAVLGFGALVSARGGQERVPYDGQMTELHKDEMVLPAHIASPLRASIAGIGPRNSDQVLSLSRETSVSSKAGSTDLAPAGSSVPPVNFYAAKGMTKSEVEKQASTLVKVMKNAYRNREFSDL